MGLIPVTPACGVHAWERLCEFEASQVFAVSPRQATQGQPVRSHQKTKPTRTATKLLLLGSLRGGKLRRTEERLRPRGLASSYNIHYASALTMVSAKLKNCSLWWG